LTLMINGIASRIRIVKGRIETAARDSGRDPGEIKLIAVSKTHPVSAVREAVDEGLRVFGENKVQEGVTKIAEMDMLRCEWHLIGHLQKNKVRKAVRSFSVIQTIDSLDLALRVDRIAGEERTDPFPVLIQIDLAGEETKSGLPESEAEDLVFEINKCRNLRLDGLMTILPFLDDVEMVRPYFRRLREIRDGLKEKGAFGGGIGELSMGMSHDFETAIEEGSTMVRVGTAIFGSRR
jgi:pyridoxal phosphate enzyme (YggS family)